jgi:hypothetical protein
VLAQWHNSQQEEMLHHSDTLSWFRDNQSLLLLRSAVCLAGKQQIQLYKSLVWPDRGSNPRSTAPTNTISNNTYIFTIFNLKSTLKIIYSSVFVWNTKIHWRVSYLMIRDLIHMVINLEHIDYLKISLFFNCIWIGEHITRETSLT